MSLDMKDIRKKAKGQNKTRKVVTKKGLIVDGAQENETQEMPTESTKLD